MERRFILFLVLSFAILFGYSSFMRKKNPPPRPAPDAIAQKAADEDQAEEKEPGEEKPLDRPAEDEPEKPAPVMQAAVEPDPEQPEHWVTLGSADPKDPFRMLVTLTSKGAALARIELNDPRYRDIDERSGYLGYLTSPDDPEGNGCLVRFVGHGTPAAEAGLQPGDVLKAIDGEAVAGPKSLDAVLRRETKPKQKVQLTVLRDGKELQLTAVLRRHPVYVVGAEEDDPLSMLLTLEQIDDLRLDKTDGGEGEAEEEQKKPENKDALRPRDESIRRELAGIDLRAADWVLVESDRLRAVFRRRLPEFGLEIVKTYRLEEIPEGELQNKDYPAYHLFFEVEIRNIGDRSRKVAYQLDGPTGLPLEGKWYAYKVSRNWGGSGLRDFIISMNGNTPTMVNSSTIADGKSPVPWPDQNLDYIGVDAQYFSAVLMPDRDKPADPWFAKLQPICVGKIDPQHKNWANVSCRLTSVAAELEPNGPPLRHAMKLFAGPKRPALLENQEYNLSELVYYGWPIFAVVAVPLTSLLHVLYNFTFNYGLAIILLTVLIRGCMFPLSRKQVLGAQKMQQLQPEIKKLAEKYKGNAEARTKAQQELFRKHNYNPLSGCLPVFIQLPIFIGLYRALMVDVELRGAALLGPSIRWCSNLAAPDMLYDWSRFMPDWVNSGQGIFGLGPYFNLLPVLTIVLFIAQQKILMPPPTDEQAAMQQKIMKYMMVFMGLLFFKVASGLCIYFIASSLWGLAERQVLPKPQPAATAAATESRAQAKARERLEADKKRKESDRKRLEAEKKKLRGKK